MLTHAFRPTAFAVNGGNHDVYPDGAEPGSPLGGEPLSGPEFEHKSQSEGDSAWGSAANLRLDSSAEPSRSTPKPTSSEAGRGERNGVDLPALRVLVVDEDAALRRSCCAVVESMGFDPASAATVADAKAELRHRPADLLLLDLAAPGALELFHDTKERHPETGILMMTAFASVSSAVEAMRIGAGDYLTKPFAPDELKTVLDRAGQRVHFDLQSRRLRERLRTDRGMGDLVGQSPGMEKVYRIISKVAFSNHPVLILGESGTGKELAARAIHTQGPNAGQPFVVVDCGATAPAVIETELFGHVEGAIGVASGSREGLLAAVGEGTVFLDEIGELPLEVQAKLVRALQEKEVRPVGSTDAVRISARILAGSNRDLPAMVAAGSFRRDLFFRLNVVNIRMPALRERRDDIRALAEFFLQRLDAKSGLSHSFSADAVRAMTLYDWPGNVRELEHAIERACALSSGPMLHMADLPTQLQEFRMHAQWGGDTGVPQQKGGRILSIADMERNAIVETVRKVKGDKLLAARLLGIGKTTLYRKLKEYGISAGEMKVELN